MDIWTDLETRVTLWFLGMGVAPYAFFVLLTYIRRYLRHRKLNERRGRGGQYYSDRTEYYIVNGRNVDLRGDTSRDVARAAMKCADSQIKKLNRRWEKRKPTEGPGWFWFLAFTVSLMMANDPFSPFQFIMWIWYSWCLFKAVEFWRFNLLEDEYYESWGRWNEVFWVLDFSAVHVSDEQHLVRFNTLLSSWSPFNSANEERPAGRIWRRGGGGFVDVESDHHWTDDGHPIWQVDR